MDLRSVGSAYTKKDVIDVFVYQKLKEFKKEDKPLEDVTEETIKEEAKEEQPKEKKLTMSDFFDEFKL